MKGTIREVTLEHFSDIIDIFNPCMDDYLYIMDMQKNVYCISQNAAKRFDLPSDQFDNASDHFSEFVYPEDMELLNRDLEQIVLHGKEFHNLQYRWLSREGRPIWINCRGRVLRGENGDAQYLIGCINEIGMRQKADNVSGLLRETSLQNELDFSNIGALHGFLIRLGIDNFKEINENKGLDYGDMVIGRTAECIQSVLLPGQMLYRMVADEYVVFDREARSVEEAVEIYHKIQHEINCFIEEKCYEVFYTVSAGIVELSPVDNQEYRNIMKLSEFALNEAKNTGKNKCYIFNIDDYKAFLHKKELISQMLWSVNHDFEGFEAYFQPIMDMKAQKLGNAETLLRFRSPNGEMVSPVEFIPLLEESNLIIPVGRWVLHQAMEVCSKIRKSIPDFKVSVNLSYIQVLKSNVLEEIQKGLEKYGLSPDSVIIELTESGFLESNEYFINFCNGLKEHGILLALDDFGTGYSNFHYLYNLKLSVIKIDRSFTVKALSNPYEHNLLQHMADMIHGINLKLCIEGIETKEELDRINEIGPDFIQGYYFGRPCPFEQFLELMVS